jgi:hypothetical protein
VRVAGIAVSLTKPKRPAIRLALVDDAGGSPALSSVEEITAAAVDPVEQLLNASRTVESRLMGLKADRVVIRQADAMYASRKEGPRRRLEIEGAVAAAARAVVVDTRLATGKDLGTWCGTSKADVDSAGATLVKRASKHSKYAEAAAAALASLSR